MSHDDLHVANRSASHGAHNGPYGLPTRASAATLDSGHHLVPSFKPLRSIREHGHTFLDPAASADGMLRKTTETGNIGLFSITPGRPTALRPRASLGDLRQQAHRPFSRSNDRTTGHDARKRLPTYRDSTSEIISMYGSDNQSSAKSISGSLSPPWDDNGQRAYSMTTCGSKSHTLPRNMGMQQAHDVHTGAQRPRSPFPYPTRLPRPGIRPSSPALTENGNVDYSRMVEIDRVPQRTIHHPHKPLFPYKTTRNLPAPLSLRYGVNQSTRSLSDDRGPPRPFPATKSRRSPLLSHLHSWGLSPRDRVESDLSDQSMRTMSLTSTNGGYACAPPHIPRLPVQERKPPIFYDYSEDFEDAVDPPPHLPIANPTPTRVSASPRAGARSEECDAPSESADEGVGHVVDYLRRMTMIESVEDQDEDQNEDQNEEGQDAHDKDYNLEHHRPVSQLCARESLAQPSQYRETVEQGLASPPVLPKLPRVIDKSGFSDAILDDHQDLMAQDRLDGLSHITESIANGLVSEASTAESPMGPDTPACDKKLHLAEPARYDDDDDSLGASHRSRNEGTNDNDLPDGVVESQMTLPEPATPMISKLELNPFVSATLPYRYSCGRKDSRFYSLGSGMSDLASFIKHIDNHMETLDQEQEQDDTDDAGLSSDIASDCERLQCRNKPATSAPPRTSSLANQRRSYTGPKLNNSAPFDELERYQVVSTRSGPTLVPQPISPAKMLRVKNSIPQLMKALPPLPSYSPATESPFSPTLEPVEFEPFEFSRLTDARSTLIEPIRSQYQEEEAREIYDPFNFDRAVRKPRLKLKGAVSHSPGQVRRTRPSHLEEADGTEFENAALRRSAAESSSIAPVKRRLPIKVSRSMVDSLAIGTEESGTVKRRPGFDKSSTVSELASFQPVDLFTTKALETAVSRNTPLPLEPSPSRDREYGSLPVARVTPMARVQRVTVIDEARGASLDTQLDAQQSPRARTETATEDGMQSFFSDSSVKPQRGLRKRLSNLKSRLTESRRHPQNYLVNAAAHDNKDDRAADRLLSNHAMADSLTSTSPTKAHHAVTATATVRSRWGKLVKGAKHRLRAWGKNRHKGG